MAGDVGKNSNRGGGGVSRFKRGAKFSQAVRHPGVTGNPLDNLPPEFRSKDLLKYLDSDANPHSSQRPKGDGVEGEDNKLNPKLGLPSSGSQTKGGVLDLVTKFQVTGVEGEPRNFRKSSPSPSRSTSKKNDSPKNDIAKKPSNVQKVPNPLKDDELSRSKEKSKGTGKKNEKGVDEKKQLDKEKEKASQPTAKVQRYRKIIDDLDDLKGKTVDENKGNTYSLEGELIDKLRALNGGPNAEIINRIITQLRKMIDEKAIIGPVFKRATKHALDFIKCYNECIKECKANKEDNPTTKELKESKLENAELELKDELLTLVSNYGSFLLTCDNPNIADLSDKFRPTKLGEVFSSTIFDGEAYSDTIEKRSERGIPKSETQKLLLSTIEEIWKACKEEITNLKPALLLDEKIRKKLCAEVEAFKDCDIEKGNNSDEDWKTSTLCEEVMANFPEVSSETFNKIKDREEKEWLEKLQVQADKLLSKDELTSEDKTQLKAVHKKLGKKWGIEQGKGDLLPMAKNLLKALDEKVAIYQENKKFKQTYRGEDSERVNKFCREILAVSCQMLLQTPPMKLLTELPHGSTIDRDLFVKVNNMGKQVDFVVWPAILLCEGGPVVLRGSVAPIPTKKVKS